MTVTSTTRPVSLRLRFCYWLYARTYAIHQWSLRHVTLAGALALTGLGTAAVVGLDTNLSMAYQAFTFLLAVLLVALLLLRLLRPPPLAVERRLPRLASVGIPLSYTALVRNPTRRLQRDLLLREERADPRPTLATFAAAPEPGEAKRNWFDRQLLYYRWKWLIRGGEHAQFEPQPVPAVPAGGELAVRMELTPVRRGVLRFLGLSLTVPEPFGLLRRALQQAQPATLVILPQRYPVPHLALPGSRKYQPGGVALAASIGESDEFMALRDYRPGDARRRIHWRSWARTGKPVVKEFEDEFFVRHALILDTFSSVPESEVFEGAVSVASSFACTIDTQESLLDLLFVGTEAYCFTAGRGLGYSEQLLTVLASVGTCHERPFDDLANLVLRRAALVSGAVCVFIAWDALRQQLVSRLLALGVPLRVCVVTAPDAPKLAPGPLQANPQMFHQLETDKLAPGLAAMG